MFIARRSSSLSIHESGWQGVGEAAELGDRAAVRESLICRTVFYEPLFIESGTAGGGCLLAARSVIARCAAVSRCRLPMLERVGHVPFTFGCVCRAIVRVGGALVCPGSSLAGL